MYTQDWTTLNISNWTNILSQLIDKDRNDSIKFLEIGCFEGRSSRWFLENILHHKNDRLYCVDPYIHPTISNFDKLVEPVFYSSIEKSGAKNKVIKMKEKSIRALSMFNDDFFDVIYVDGDHEASTVLHDSIQSFRICKTRGIIIFDDYEWNDDTLAKHNPKKAIDWFLDVYKDKLDIIYLGYQVAIRKLNV